MKLLLCFTFSLLVFGTTEFATAQSLWQHRNDSRVFMLTDTRAHGVGDVLTVLIRENTDVENKDERAADKATDIGGTFGFNGATAANGGGGTASASFDSKTTSNRKFDGTSEYKVEREFSDRLTVAVLDVQPNGNFVIGGRRRVVVSGEARTLVVTGVVRPYDIGRNNTVQSQFVGNLEMHYEGKGPESHFSNQGWLGRITNKVWPF